MRIRLFSLLRGLVLILLHQKFGYWGVGHTRLSFRQSLCYDSVTTPGIADAAPMIYVNDTLYKQSTSQTSFTELKDNFVYLGVIESDVTNIQGTNDAGNYLDGIPKENFQANHPIVGAEVYQYGENIVVGIGGKYWLYENYHSTDLDGNPDGYGPLPNNQTSGEEVSEQDPAAN